MTAKQYKHWKTPSLSLLSYLALTIIAVTLTGASVAGFLGTEQLKAALTFDQEAFNATSAQGLSIRLQLDEETAVRGYAATHNRFLLEPYVSAVGRLNGTLTKLAAVSSALDLTNAQNIVAALQKGNTRWLHTIRPLTEGHASTNQAYLIELHGKELVDEYRRDETRFAQALNDRIADHSNASSQRFLHIGVLFFASVIMCAFGITIATFRQLDDARKRVRHASDSSSVKSFQKALLPPRLPEVPGCTFDAIYEPGVSDAQVGGDWYDAVRLADGRVVISIGDVAGSGLDAAVIMGVVRQIMRGIAQVHPDPALMLDAADRALRLEHEGVFVTAWVGVVDLFSRTLTYASAGHPPPLLGSRDGSSYELCSTCLPLGLRQGQDAVTEVPLPDGSTLVLYTDGLTEATRDIVAGSKRLEQAVKRIAAAPWGHPAAEIQRQVLVKESTDDIAILVARFDFAQAEQHVKRFTFDGNDASGAHNARRSFIAELPSEQFTPVDLFNAEIVFGELVGNVLRHTVRGDAIEVAIDSSGRQTVLHVLDRGPGFRHSSRLSTDLYSESGRGLFLINALTDDFSVTDRPGGGSHARVVLIGRTWASLIYDRSQLRVPPSPEVLALMRSRQT